MVSCRNRSGGSKVEVHSDKELMEIRAVTEEFRELGSKFCPEDVF